MSQDGGVECVHGLTAAWCSDCSQEQGALPKRGTGSKRTIDPKMRDLLGAGVVVPGTELRGRHKGALHTATLQSDGTIYLDGRYFDSPTGAATYITGTSVNGWIWWRIGDDLLADLRSQLDTNR
ncbi:restriction system modified-DNA reader domain-containing protein [Nocardioides zeicaulis]|uniref:DUF2924 domain-containing protein n=1 Tax=Nocardioides zeicaulis TaxID=1776857 RepID=A0ABV6E743_9ACTN